MHRRARREREVDLPPRLCRGAFIFARGAENSAPLTASRLLSSESRERGPLSGTGTTGPARHTPAILMRSIT